MGTLDPPPHGKTIAYRFDKIWSVTSPDRLPYFSAGIWNASPSFPLTFIKNPILHRHVAYSKKALVGIIMGSSSDSKVMHAAAEILDEFGVKHEDQIVSAHRTPTRLEDYAKHAEREGFKVIIAGAGGSAHLPGMIASHTIIPVIGVPIMVYNDKGGQDKFKFSAFGGLDSLLSISEMPTGSPVVTVGVNKAANAGLYALKILANEHPDLRRRLKGYKVEQHRSVMKESEEMRRLGLARFATKRFKK